VLPSLTDERVRELTDRAAALIRDTIGCTMAVTLVGAGEAPRSDGGKIQRVRDLR
jgi:phenylacetate-CoA ligase